MKENPFSIKRFDNKETLSNETEETRNRGVLDRLFAHRLEPLAHLAINSVPKPKPVEFDKVINEAVELKNVTPEEAVAASKSFRYINSGDKIASTS